jgi:hypothetical protein
MGASQIPPDVAAAIKRCWPNGVLDEFETSESYFHEIHPALERALRNIRGASLLWQTEQESGARWDAGEDDEPQRCDEWQSYHVFFLAPHGKEFHFEDRGARSRDRVGDGKASHPGLGQAGSESARARTQGQRRSLLGRAAVAHLVGLRLDAQLTDLDGQAGSQKLRAVTGEPVAMLARPTKSRQVFGRPLAGTRLATRDRVVDDREGIPSPPSVLPRLY